MNNRSVSRRNALIGLAIVMILIMGAVVQLKYFTCVVIINGEKINYEEFQFYMNRERTTAVSELQQSIGNETSGTPEHSHLKTEKLYRIIFERALQQLVLQKSQWQMAKSLGIAIQNNQSGISENIPVTKSDYSFFNYYYNLYTEAVKSNHLLYGPTNLSKEQIYFDLLQRIGLELKLKMAANPAGNDMKADLKYYEESYLPSLAKSADVHINQVGVWYQLLHYGN